MLIGICGQKGGTGKTTLATNLAVYFAQEGAKVVLVDTDPQGSAYAWYQRRLAGDEDLARVTVIRASGDVYDLLGEQARNYEVVLVDSGGFDSDALRTSIAVSNLVYVPLQPSQLDIDTTAKVHELVRQAQQINRNLVATAIISRAPTNILNRERLETREALESLPSLEISGVTIYDRKVYRDAVLEGKGVTEMDNPKARAEIQLVGQEIVETLERILEEGRMQGGVR